MTIFGIAGSMGLMLVGFGLYDSIMDIAILQYDQIQHYDAMVINDEDATDSQEKGSSEIPGRKQRDRSLYPCAASPR